MTKTLHLMMAAFFFLLAVFIIYKPVKAQEQGGGGTTWNWHYNAPWVANMTVYETPGACVYSVGGYGVAAIPRTQLPAGKGC